MLIMVFFSAISAGVGMNEEPAVGRNNPVHRDRLRMQLTFHPDPRIVKAPMLFCRDVSRLRRLRGSADEMTAECRTVLGCVEARWCPELHAGIPFPL